MQIEMYKPDRLNLNEFINHYDIQMILNNTIIKQGSFELYNDDEMLEIEREINTDYIKFEIEKKDISEYSTLKEIYDYYYSQDYTLEELLKMNTADALEELHEAIYDYSTEHYQDGEIYQYFIVSEYDVERYLLKYLPNYEIFYSEELDVYLLGVGHWGMSWSFFFTQAPRPNHMKIPEYDEILKGSK